MSRSLMFHMFGYLKSHYNTETVFDPSDPVINCPQFQKRDWALIKFGHIEGIEELPLTCHNQEDLVSPSELRSMLTMLVTRSQEDPGQDFLCI